MQRISDRGPASSAFSACSAFVPSDSTKGPATPAGPFPLRLTRRRWHPFRASVRQAGRAAHAGSHPYLIPVAHDPLLARSPSGGRPLTTQTPSNRTCGQPTCSEPGTTPRHILRLPMATSEKPRHSSALAFPNTPVPHNRRRTRRNLMMPPRVSHLPTLAYPTTATWPHPSATGESLVGASADRVTDRIPLRATV